MRDTRFTYSANLSLLFTEHPLLDRPAAAAAAGFEHVEMWWPFAAPDPGDAEVDALLAAVQGAGVTLAGLNFYAGDMGAGERGVASLPDRVDELAVSTRTLLRIAQATGCRFFNLLYGVRDERWTPDEQDAHAVRSIRQAAEAVAEVGGTVLLEPLAIGLNGSYPLTTPSQIVDLLEGPLAEIDNVGLLYDLFHIGSNGLDIVAEASPSANHIAHVQVADSPGRGEPGSGGLPIDDALRALAAAGYRGLVACEYKPTRRTEETLGWIEHQA
ncbi:hydroxypyruvate isomerase family protein [Pseudactinotalea suaedae]|uniref:hydroxypyruvate isomerase family protein n=1 Tax=Pseudactinotalea suaedae TaxID=1524924 RepID=UPI0012E14FC8|nr:TIM barrel protein [Pseudactinotalea suaedae]